MANRKNIERAADLILAIEAEMRRIELWQETAPSPTALASTMPFCYDTLEPQQWLQWVFLPRMKALIENDGPLPTASNIQPLVEHHFRGQSLDTARLEALLGEFDRLIEGHTG